MKKLYMKKLGLLVMLSGLFLGPVWGLTEYTTYSLSNNAVVSINDDVSVSGTLELGNNSTLTIQGDLTVGGQIIVGSGANLIVYGNLRSTAVNKDIQINGTILVVGDFDVAYGADIKNNGNLIVGGNFIQKDGSIETQGNNNDLKIYIINPDAIIDVPDGSIVNDPTKVGGFEDFKTGETGLPQIIRDIVEAVIVPAVIGDQWVGNNGNSNWNDPANWTGNNLPLATSNVRIKASNDNPVIDLDNGLIEVKNLTIEDGAVLTLKPGAKLTVNGDLSIKIDGGLVLESRTGANNLASLITNGVVTGRPEVKLQIEGNRWYHLSSAVKTPTFGELGAADSPSNFRIDIYRRAIWISIYPEFSGSLLRPLEGYTVKNSKDELRNIDLIGDLNTGEIVRAFAEGGWHLLGNPYPSAINWTSAEGWKKENVLPTIWYRTQIGTELVFVTYNAESNLASHDPEMVNASFSIGDDFSIIPPYQSVWIKTMTNAPASITVDNRVRLHSLSDGSNTYSTPQLKSSSIPETPNRIRIIASNQFTRDASVLFFGTGNSEGYGTEDSEKYFNSSTRIPEIFTKVDGRSVAINGLPELSAGSYLHIPISVRNRDDSPVTLKFNLDDFSSNHSLALIDNETGEYLPLTSGTEYTYVPNNLGDNHERFVLTLTPSVTTNLESPNEGEVDADNRISIKSIAGKVLVSVGTDLLQNGPGVIEIYTMDGRKISDVPGRSSRTLVILPNERGVYIVRAKYGNLVKSERVVNSSK